MKNFDKLIAYGALLTLVSGLFLVFNQTADAQSPGVGATAAVVSWTDFQAATVVLGQATFTTSASGSGNNKFDNPIGIAVDPTSSKVFVSELSNNRVLRFSSMQAAMNGGTAEAVLGQPDFATVSQATTQSKMNGPQGITVDSAGRLWVTDTFNNRVLRFDSAAAKADGANADGVLGQTTFNTATFATTQNGMTFPSGIFSEGGRIWVSEQSNNRVLRFDNAATKVNGANADGVLGQPDFNTNTAAVTQTGMSLPLGVVVDSAGRLWVADFFNNRVLRFDNAAAKADGANADGVLGQTTFTTNTTDTTQNGMNGPRGVTVDLTGRLYVADQGNNRILIFNNAAALTNGANAANVLGQPGFTSATANNGGISAKSLSGPPLIFFDEASQNLFVVDSTNNRVLRFAPAGTTAASVSVSGKVLTDGGRGLTGAIVTLTDSQGATRTAGTTTFGYYHFDEVAAGQTYIVSIRSRRFSFAPQVINVTEDVHDLNFAAQ